MKDKIHIFGEIIGLAEAEILVDCQRKTNSGVEHATALIPLSVGRFTPRCRENLIGSEVLIEVPHFFLLKLAIQGIDLPKITQIEYNRLLKEFADSSAEEPIEP